MQKRLPRENHSKLFDFSQDFIKEVKSNDLLRDSWQRAVTKQEQIWWGCKKTDVDLKRVKGKDLFQVPKKKMFEYKRMRIWWATKRKRKRRTKETKKMWNMCVKRGTLNSLWHSRIVPQPFVNHFKQIFEATGRWWEQKKKENKLDFNYLGRLFSADYFNTFLVQISSLTIVALE